jgi:hypothetical protein
MSAIRLTSVSLILAAALLSGCAASPSLQEGYAEITVNDRFGNVSKCCSIAELDGQSTGAVFQPKTVYVKPGMHAVVEHIYRLAPRFIFRAEAGRVYELPSQAGTDLVIQEQNQRRELQKVLRASDGERFE